MQGLHEETSDDLVYSWAAVGKGGKERMGLLGVVDGQYRDPGLQAAKKWQGEEEEIPAMRAMRALSG